MDNFREYLILQDALINTNNNVTSKYNIYILLIIIFILLAVICYLIKKMTEMSTINKSINSLPQIQNHDNQLENFRKYQLENNKQNYLMLRANPGLPSNYMNTSRNTYNNAPVIEDMY